MKLSAFPPHDGRFRTMKRFSQLFIWVFAVIFPMTSCSGTLTVEPDPHDPRLHGQVVRFNVPIVYLYFNEKDAKTKHFDEKSLGIGKLLIREEVAHSLFDRDKTHVINKITPETPFIVNESYWVRHDWFTREFAPDRDMVVLQDDKGTLSVTFRSLLLDTDKPELGENDR